MKKNLLGKENVLQILMQIGILGLFTLPLIIKRGHSYSVILLFIGSLIYFWKGKKITLLKQDKYLFGVFLAYALIGLLIGLYHHEKMRVLEHSFRFVFVIPIMFYLLAYPATSKFIFICAGLGATNAGFVAAWNKFYLGFSRATDYLNAIFFAEIILILVIFCLCGFKLVPTIQSKAKKYSYIGLLLLGILGGVIAIILSKSRGAWIVLPVVMIGVAILYQLSKKQAFIFILGSALLLSSSYFIPQTGVKYRIHKTISAFQPNTKETSVSSRLEMWKAAVPMIKSKPLLGWGKIGANKEKMRMIKQGKAHKKIGRIGHWHNIYMEKIVKQGLLGLLSLLCLFLIPLNIFIKESMNNPTHENRALSYCGILTVLSHMIFGMTDTLLNHNIGTIFYCLPILILWAIIRMNNDVKAT